MLSTCGLLRRLLIHGVAQATPPTTEFLTLNVWGGRNCSEGYEIRAQLHGPLRSLLRPIECNPNPLADVHFWYRTYSNQVFYLTVTTNDVVVLALDVTMAEGGPGWLLPSLHGDNVHPEFVGSVISFIDVQLLDLYDTATSYFATEFPELKFTSDEVLRSDDIDYRAFVKNLDSRFTFDIKLKSCFRDGTEQMNGIIGKVSQISSRLASLPSPAGAVPYGGPLL
jgi:hypothetical protein